MPTPLAFQQFPSLYPAPTSEQTKPLQASLKPRQQPVQKTCCSQKNIPQPRQTKVEPKKCCAQRKVYPYVKKEAGASEKTGWGRTAVKIFSVLLLAGLAVPVIQNLTKPVKLNCEEAQKALASIDQNQGVAVIPLKDKALCNIIDACRTDTLAVSSALNQHSTGQCGLPGDNSDLDALLKAHSLKLLNGGHIDEFIRLQRTSLMKADTKTLLNKEYTERLNKELSNNKPTILGSVGKNQQNEGSVGGSAEGSDAPIVIGSPPYSDEPKQKQPLSFNSTSDKEVKK
jgi:hypothetical protein